MEAGGGVSGGADHTSDIPVKQIKIAWVRHDRLLELNRRRKKDGFLDDYKMITIIKSKIQCIIVIIWKRL